MSDEHVQLKEMSECSLKQIKNLQSKKEFNYAATNAVSMKSAPLQYLHHKAAFSKIFSTIRIFSLVSVYLTPAQKHVVRVV